MVHERRVITTVELHVNATYYAQHPALKLVYEKSQSLVIGKLFSSYKTVLELAQGLRGSKKSDLNCSYEALSQKELLTIYQDRVFVSFFCVLSLSSALERFMHLYCDTDYLGSSTPLPHMGVKNPHSSPAFPIYLL